MRPLPLILGLALAGLACRSGARPPGALFASGGLLAPLSQAEEAHDALLHADVSRADSVARLGYAAGLATVLADDVLFLRGGLPALRGRPAALAIAAAEGLGSTSSLRWQPLRVEASRDGASGYSYGYAVRGSAQPGAPSLRIDRYIAWWRRGDAGWRIAAYAETYGAPPVPIALSDALRGSVIPDQPMRSARGAADAVRATDVEFSRTARTVGTGEAFGRFAAHDAQIFSASGELTSGPEAIVRSFGPPSDGSSLVWHPIAADASSGGDLGVTIGNAVLTTRREDGSRDVHFSKYLTVWRRQRDGTWRFVVDGGSARPAQ